MNEPHDQLKIALLGNAHIDMIYRWRLNETLGRVVPDTFRGVLDVMDRFPEFTYAQSQFALYDAVRDRYPALWTRILQRIEDGRWIVVGGKWVESDSMLPGGESLIRQFVLGDGFAREEMGLETIRVAWIPDCFGGHTHTTPQIYAGCGIDFYLFNRGCPEDVRCFWWESPDGTRIFAYKIPKHYNLKIDEELESVVADWSRVSGVEEALVLYGEGDHGGGPRDGDMDDYDRLSSSPSFSPDLVHGKPVELLERARDARNDWPVLTGDIGVQSGTGSHRGAHISQARLKRTSRRLEHAILVAERLSTFGALSQRKFFFPRYDLRNLWKRYLLHQFHDTLPGTLVGDAVDDVMRDYDQIRAEAERLTQFGLEAVGARLNTTGDGVPLMVFNPSAWPRSAVVTATVRRPVCERIFRVTTSEGRDVAFVCDSGEAIEHELRFLAQEVPPCGHAVYRVFSHSAGDSESSSTQSVRPTLLSTGDGRAETDAFVVEWNDRSVSRIYDRRREAELVSDGTNTLLLRSEAKSSSWHVQLSGESARPTPVSGARVLLDDGLTLRVQWVDRSEDSLFVREMILSSGSERIDFKLTVEWHEADRLLCVEIPTALANSRAVFESPYGTIERPCDGTYWPMQKWVARETDELGVAVLNDGIYSSGGHDGTVELAVLRSARDMDPRMDEGAHEFRYSIFPYEPSLGRTAPVRQSFELSEPLLCEQQTRHRGFLPNWGSFRNDYELPSGYSFARVNAQHTLLTVVKVLEGDWNPDELVLRLYEVDGSNEQVSVMLERLIAEVVEVNHIEQALAGGDAVRTRQTSFSFDIGPHQIRTFRVQLAGGRQGG
jgi:alpha-mannosidase